MTLQKTSNNKPIQKNDTDINIDTDDNAITTELHDEKGSNREKDNNDIDEQVYKEDKDASWTAYAVEE